VLEFLLKLKKIYFKLFLKEPVSYYSFPLSLIKNKIKRRKK